jgi:hypothetical protein
VNHPLAIRRYLQADNQVRQTMNLVIGAGSRMLPVMTPIASELPKKKF